MGRFCIPIILLFYLGSCDSNSTYQAPTQTVDTVKKDTTGKYSSAFPPKSNKKKKKSKKGTIDKSINGYTVAAPTTTRTRKHGNTVFYSSQCQATTKKGYRCSRTTRSGGYCWQHGG